jgi:ankyrin repeat protein
MSNVRQEWYQFRDALERGDFVTASTLLEKDSSLLNERNNIGESVLHFLAVENNRPAIEWLHLRGANLNAFNEFGTPLLFEVAQLDYRELFLWLIEHGADPQKKDAQGRRIAEYLAEFDKPEIISFVKKHIKP